MEERGEALLGMALGLRSLSQPARYGGKEAGGLAVKAKRRVSWEASLCLRTLPPPTKGSAFGGRSIKQRLPALNNVCLDLKCSQ